MSPRLIASIIFCLLLSACSTKLAYNYLDWILEWYVEDLVTLSEDQEWLFRNALARELNWHRKKQLPLYVKSLDDLHDAMNSGLTVEALGKIYSEQENGLQELARQITPAMSQLLATLSDKQVEQLLENLEEQNQELAEEYVNKPAAELVKQRTERMVDRAENWLGTLNDAQTRLITEWSQQIRPTATQWIANRRAWQTRLGDSLKTSRHSPDFINDVEELFVNGSAAWPAAYRKDFEHNLDITLRMLVSLQQQLSDRQRQHLSEEIAVLRKQLVELHNQ